MFEDFRKQSEDASFQEEELQSEISHRFRMDDDRLILGLTPAQRFVLAFMLLVMMIILGVLFLLVTNKVVPPTFG